MNAALKKAHKFDEKCPQSAKTPKPKLIRATG
jgi:hypothetical protein